MENALRTVRRALLAAATLAVCAGVGAATLYKSIDPEGRVTFSDTPIEGAVKIQRIDSSDSAKPAEGAPAPVYLALADSFDESVARANEKLDMAEHALALARSALNGHDPLALSTPRPSRAEARQLDFYKRDVIEARRDLLRVLRQRNTLYAANRPLA